MTTGQTSGDLPKTQRLPAPSLFIGPPSRNASNISLLPQSKDPSTATRAPLTRKRSHLSDRSRTDKVEGSIIPPYDSHTPGGLLRRQAPPPTKAEQESNERTDALWAEMQNTLEEVELSATSGTHLFGPNHSKALEELRTAQIALAQAWAKSEAQEESQAASKAKEAHNDTTNTADVLASDRQEKFQDAGRTGTDKSATSGKTQLEEETENDIALARKRREANDKYFERVNKGVVDVVKKLEEVAAAMKGVELESNEIWDKDSADTASST